MPDQRNPDPDRELLEDVHYRVGYFGESRATEEAVVRAVARLPEDVREFACDQCRFISVGHALGYYLPGRVGLDPATDTTEGIWLILLADGQTPRTRRASSPTNWHTSGSAIRWARTHGTGLLSNAQLAT